MDQELLVAMVSVLSSLGRVHRILANGIADEPVILGNDDRPKGDDNNLDTEPAPHILDSRQSSSDTFNLETPPILSNRTANKRDNYESTVTGKQQWSVSPRPAVRDTSKSPFPYSKDPKSSLENIDFSDDESADDDVLSKRRRLSPPLGGSTVLNCYKKQPQRSPSPISEDDDKDEEKEGTLSISADCKPVSNASTGPAAFESVSPTEPQLAVQVIDDNQDWEVCKIIGKEDVDGVLHYLVDWSPTLVPEHSLGHAKELVDEFEARLLALREVKNGQRGPGSKRDERAVVEVNVSGRQQKRPRGWPRKQA
jgi:hypothetical protein